MKRIVKPSPLKSILSLVLCLCVLTVTGCQHNNLPRTPQGAVIQEIDRTDTTVDTFPLPKDYYFEDDYLLNKAAVINDLLAKSGENGEAFVFITDPHTENGGNAGQTPRLLHYLCAETELSRTFIGGDIFTGTAANYAVTMEEAFTDGTVHYVTGNIDYNRKVTDANLTTVYHKEKPEEIGHVDRQYYYVDSPENKLRYIVLNSWMEGSATADDLDAQSEWLKNEALCVEDGWGILVFVHSFVVREWTRDTDLRYLYSPMKPIATTLLEYDGAGEILAVFHGSRHQDMVSRMHLDTDAQGNTVPALDDNCGGIPLIQTASDGYLPNAGNYPYEQLIDRKLGTITEQAFDVVIVDREAGQIHCVRIGAPARDKTGWLDQEQVEVRTINIRE